MTNWKTEFLNMADYIEEFQKINLCDDTPAILMARKAAWILRSCLGMEVNGYDDEMFSSDLTSLDQYYEELRKNYRRNTGQPLE